MVRLAYILEVLGALLGLLGFAGIVIWSGPDCTEFFCKMAARYAIGIVFSSLTLVLIGLILQINFEKE
jgi:hypothetical protein